jgi:hypothetical protein
MITKMTETFLICPKKHTKASMEQKQISWQQVSLRLDT